MKKRAVELTFGFDFDCSLDDEEAELDKLSDILDEMINHCWDEAGRQGGYHQWAVASMPEAEDAEK